MQLKKLIIQPLAMACKLSYLMQLNITHILLFSVSSLSRALVLEVQFLQSSWGKLLALMVRCLARGMEGVSDLVLDFLPWCPMQGFAWLCCIQNWSWEGSRGTSWITAQELIAGVWSGAAPQACWNSSMAFCSPLNPLGFEDATGTYHCLGWGFSNVWLEKPAFSQAFQPGSK